jgi:uncharacterized repeat protein (TIGR01451 family)
MRILKLFLICGFMLMAIQLFAQGKPKLEMEISETKINMSATEKTGESDIVYSPGDTIEYTILAKNVGKGLMTKPEIVDPIPQGVVYLANSAKGTNSQIFFSINDGRQYTEWPIMISVTNDQGVQVGKKASADQVTHIKWMINEAIPAGGQKELSFRVTVK